MSFLGYFFQNLFGGGGNNEHNSQRYDHESPKNKFRNPIWQNTEDTDEYNDDYRRFSFSDRDSTFQIFTHPFEMMQYFESQMDNMLKDIMSFRLNDDALMIESFHDENNRKLCPSQKEKINSVRDQFLKPNHALSSSNDEQSGMKMDLDLDGKVSANDIPQIWNDSKNDDNKLMRPISDAIIPNPSELFSNSTFFNFTIQPNVRMEQISTVIDGAGNIETTIKRQIGDEIHTVITKRNKDGMEIKTENFTNLNKIDDGPSPKVGASILGKSLWDQFFNIDPK